MSASNGRCYRDQPSRPIPVWNGILEHLPKMGMAVWLYLWCLDRITHEQDGVGYVLGGTPVKVERIVGELGRSERAIRRDLSRLRGRYLRLRWTPFGYVIQVLNSRKFGIWRGLGSPAKNGKADGRSGEAVTENGRSKGDSAVRVSTAAAEAAAASDAKTNHPWEAIGVRPCGPEEFRRLVENFWVHRNGQTLPEFMGAVLDAWDLIRGRRGRPEPFCRALTCIREREKNGGAHGEADDVVPLEVPD